MTARFSRVLSSVIVELGLGQDFKLNPTRRVSLGSGIDKAEPYSTGWVGFRWQTRVTKHVHVENNLFHVQKRFVCYHFDIV